MDDLGRLFEDSQHKRFEQLMDCIHEVQAWFKEDQPEHDLKVNVNALKRDGESVLIITSRLLTSKQMVDDQCLMQNKYAISEDKWGNPQKMDKLLITFVESYKKMLLDAINNHYNSEKE